MRKTKNEGKKMVQLHRTSICIVLLGVVTLSLVVNPVTAARLATPTLIVPASGQHFYQESAQITMVWRPVAHANSYTVEVQTKISPTIWLVLYSVPNTATYRTDAFIPGATYRWRITADDTTHAYDSSLPSAWRTFDFPVGSIKLATPALLSPASGTTMYHSPRRYTVAWKPVPGADHYHLYMEHYDTATRTWVPNPARQVNDEFGTEFTGDYPSSGRVRWSVAAHNTTGMWGDSSQSNWWTFTFTV